MKLYLTLASCIFCALLIATVTQASDTTVTVRTSASCGGVTTKSCGGVARQRVVVTRERSAPLRTLVENRRPLLRRTTNCGG